MTPSTRSATLGWPFLIAAGRHRDYRTLLAPDFLVAELDYGMLDISARPAPETDPPKVVDVTTAGGRSLTLVYVTRVLSAADLGGAEGVGSAAAVRDEHNRPLRLIYGFVTARMAILAPATADLELALATALDVYRRYLDNEDSTDVLPSSAFPLRSEAISPPPVPTHRAVRTAVPGRMDPRVAVAAASACVAVVAAVVVLWPRSPGPQPCPTPGPHVTVAPTCPPSGPGPVPSGLRSAGSEATGATGEDGTRKGPGPAPAKAGANKLGPGPVPSGLRSAGSAATRATREDGTRKGPGPAPAKAGANKLGPGPVPSGLRSAGSAATRATREDGTSKRPRARAREGGRQLTQPAAGEQDDCGREEDARACPGRDRQPPADVVLGTVVGRSR